jgi:Ca-activated chloride channel family protein
MNESLAPFAEIAAVAVAIVVALAEMSHRRRVRRLAHLAFGPSAKPARWTRAVAPVRVVAASAVAWALVTLLFEPPRTYVAQEMPDHLRRNILLVLDVSPSMRLKDAGPEGLETRMQRARALMDSFFQRVPMNQYLVSVVACFNGAKPVVVRSKDIEVIRNILGDLPMNYAFPRGETNLFAGIEEAAKMAQPWNPRSTVLVLLTDGDTVPATGMPNLPESIADVLVVGVGNPRGGSFIDGRQSRQDANTLRQVAVRLSGTYHDGNTKHIPTDLIRQLTLSPTESPFEQLTKRDYALLAALSGAASLALLPVMLHFFGTRWRPGIQVDPAPRRTETTSLRKFGVTSTGK